MAKSLREERRIIRAHKQRVRSVIFGVVVISVLGLAGYYLKNAFFRPPPPAMAGNVIDVKADMSGFDKKEIQVKVGEPVTIRLTSMDNSGHTDGGGKHQLAKTSSISTSLHSPWNLTILPLLRTSQENTHSTVIFAVVGKLTRPWVAH